MDQFGLNKKLFGRADLTDYVIIQHSVTIYSDHIYLTITLCGRNMLNLHESMD
jgi:hypothetical protein